MIRKLLLSFALLTVLNLQAQYKMEYLDRGIIAVPDSSGKIHISWRLLGNEPYETAFHLYVTENGKQRRLNKQPITRSTSFLDTMTLSGIDRHYEIRKLYKKKESSEGTYLLKAGAKPFLEIPTTIPNGYSLNDASVGDMDGDGQYEIVVHLTGRGRDNSQAGPSDPPVFQCFRLNGEKLWTIHLGRNIREGGHYTQFMVYDLDGDGRAEIAMKTADGTVDGLGKVIGDSTKNYVDARGFILKGPEYLTVFDGFTGAARHTVPYDPPRHPETTDPTPAQMKAVWGDGNGNRVDRYLACVAYLDGIHPSLIMCRGYYTRTVLAAWDFADGKLKKRWVFDSSTPGNESFAGQGNHNLTVADVDQDGRQEIVYGQMTIDDNGKGLYSTGIGHADALHVSDLDPQRPGLEVMGTQERFGDAGLNFRDAKTGQTIYKIPSVKAGDDGEGPGRALSIDVDPRYVGHESWVAGAGITGMYDVLGNRIADKTPPCNMGIYWDGDALREVLNGVDVFKWDYLSQRSVLQFTGRRFNTSSINGTKANPCLSADILGDWREEIIARRADNKALLIFSTPHPTDIKLHTLMHDPQYRMSIVWQNVAYNQPPHTSYFLGHGMQRPPLPAITIPHSTYLQKLLHEKVPYRTRRTDRMQRIPRSR